MSDLLDRLHTTKHFTKINLHGAYNLVCIWPGDECKMTFRTRYGSFKFLVMHFGLCNSPVSFQCFMNDVFADMLDVCVIIYLDNILIFTDDPHKHSDQVHEVLRWLQLHKLYAKPKKCEFHMTTTEFLGYVITPNGISMDEAKTKAIQDWPEPRKVCDVQSFLGFAIATTTSSTTTLTLLSPLCD